LAEGEADTVRYVSLAEYLLIAEVVTGTNASVLARSARIGLAESALAAPSAAFDGVEVYPIDEPLLGRFRAGRHQ
jgi:hypothetical protein